jgi:hypothetical protein
MKGFFLHDKKKWPCAFVASDLGVDGVRFTVSTHNPIDPFSRKIARDVAVGRLYSCRYSVILAGNNVKARILQQVAANRFLPTRTRQAAKLWLKNPPKPKAKKSNAA